MSPTPQPDIRVLLVDDHQIVLDGMLSLLAHADSISCVGSVNSGVEALAFLVEHEVDIVLLDINMHGMTGIEACSAILRQHQGIKVIALSMHEEAAMIRAMVEAGARGYLLKNVGYEELTLAIRRVHMGKSHYSEKAGSILMRNNVTNDIAKRSPSLSRRELQILDLIVHEFTTAEIAKNLQISFNTVESHRSNIMSKLAVKNTAGMVRIALQHKLVELRKI